MGRVMHTNKKVTQHIVQLIERLLFCLNVDSVDEKEEDKEEEAEIMLAVLVVVVVENKVGAVLLRPRRLCLTKNTIRAVLHAIMSAKGSTL